MQTFITAIGFRESAENLDSQRLNKQKVEAFQIYNAATGWRRDTSGKVIGPAKGWINHPAVKLWKGYEYSLCTYGIYICDECEKRGIADNAGIKEFFFSRLLYHPYIIPHWRADPLLRDKIIFTHRCNLVRKDPEFYGKKFKDVPDNYDDVPYFWPTRN